MKQRGILFAMLVLGAYTGSAAAQNSLPAEGQTGAILQEARRAQIANQDDDAVRLYRQVLQADPNSEQGLWYLSTLLYQKQQYPEARDLLRRFLTQRPDAGPGWAYLGLCEFQTHEFRRSLEHLQHAMAAGIGDRDELQHSLFQHVVLLLIREERYDDALDMLVKMYASGKSDPELVIPFGLAGLRLPYLPEEIPPDQRGLVDSVGNILIAMQNQKPDEAEAGFHQLLASHSDEPGVHFLYGAFLSTTRPADAVAAYKQELKLSPGHVLARIRLADLWLTQHQTEQALQMALEAVRLDGKRASAHMLCGEAYLAQGDRVKGIEELEKSRELDSQVSRTHWDLYRAYSAAGQIANADREKMELEKLSGANATNLSRENEDDPQRHVGH